MPSIFKQVVILFTDYLDNDYCTLTCHFTLGPSFCAKTKQNPLLTPHVAQNNSKSMGLGDKCWVSPWFSHVTHSFNTSEPQLLHLLRGVIAFLGFVKVPKAPHMSRTLHMQRELGTSAPLREGLIILFGISSEKLISSRPAQCTPVCLHKTTWDNSFKSHVTFYMSGISSI